MDWLIRLVVALAKALSDVGVEAFARAFPTRDAFERRRARRPRAEQRDDADDDPDDDPSPAESRSTPSRDAAVALERARIARERARLERRREEDGERDDTSSSSFASDAESSNPHPIAVAARAGAPVALLDLLTHHHPPLLPIDDAGNTALHYVARFDPAGVRAVFEALREFGAAGRARAVLLENREGERPVDRMTPRTEDDGDDASDLSSDAASRLALRRAGRAALAAETLAAEAAIGAARARRARAFDPLGGVRVAAAFALALAVARAALETVEGGAGGGAGPAPIVVVASHLVAVAGGIATLKVGLGSAARREEEGDVG